MGFRYEKAMSGIELFVRIVRAMRKRSSVVVPAASARCDAAWITGPSAIGSENGTPSSIASAPARSSSSTMRGVASGLGSPHVTYAMSPQRFSARSWRKSFLTRFKGPHLRHVLVAAPAEIHHHDLPAADRAAVAQQPAERMRRLQRGDDAFRLAQFVERLQREVVAAVVVLDAPDLLQVRVLGADGRIVEARRNRVRLRDLAELILQHHRARAVQDAEGAAAEARGMLAELLAAAARLHADEADGIVFQHLVEEADRIRAAADARHRDVGPRAGPRAQLRQRLASDDGLEIAHDLGIRVR